MTRLSSRQWLMLRFTVILVAAAWFHAMVYRDLEMQREELAAHGFGSTRLEVLSRFNTEFALIFDNARLYVERRANVTVDDVNRALDLFWSRVSAGQNATYEHAFNAHGVGISVVADLAEALPQIETAVKQLRPGVPASLGSLDAIREKFRPRVEEFSAAAYGARVKALQEANIEQSTLFGALKNYQLLFSAYGALCLLWLLGELAWASRIVDRLKASSELNRQLADTDALTGLANRRSFERELAMRHTEGRRITGLLIDVDRFKAINDTFGHAVGDAILTEVARQLRSQEPSAFLSRIAGDAFFMIVDRGQTTGLEIAKRLCAAISQPVQLGSRRYDIAVSIGVASAKAGARQVETLLQQASLALLAAKKMGDGRAVVFVEALLEAHRVQSAIQADLPEAIRQGEIEIAAQPKTRLPGGEICGYEALVRWRHGKIGPVSPELLCHTADSIGLSSTLGLAIADRAFELAATLKRSGFGARMAINVSPAFGSHATFVCDLKQVLLDRHGLTANDIELEVTEDALMLDIGTIRQNMDAFKDLGAHIAIDDFGKGHSNISRLMTLAVSDIKIDKSATDRVVEDHRARAIIKSVVELADALQIEAIVEGVETPLQASVLASLGVKQIQGYLIAPPMHPLKLMTWLEQRQHAGTAKASMQAVA